jgi:hypothetical protein
MLALAFGAGAIVFVVVPRRRRRDRSGGPGSGAQPGPLSIGSLGMQLAPAPALDSDHTAADARMRPAPSEPDEAAMPRWRRPSLMQARKADPRYSATERAPITFQGAIDAPDRRVVRYDLAQITALPDEIAAEVGLLGRGDEVVVIEQQGIYFRVRTPDGLEGWVHRTILGRSTPTSDPEPADLP